MNSYYKSLLRAGAFAFVGFTASTAVHAEFTMNWGPSGLPDINPTHMSHAVCNMPGMEQVNCALNGGGGVRGIDVDNTPFLQERIRGADGQLYYHVIVGQPSRGFAQEVYIRANAPANYTVQQAPWRDNAAPHGVPPASAAMGDVYAAPIDPRRGCPCLPQRPLDPDETGVSGIGTANPTRVQMQQILVSEGMTQEFRKDFFANKPKISQTFDVADLRSEFVLDMSNIAMNDVTQDAPIINRMEVFSEGLAIGSATFDMAVNSQASGSNVTAGKYRWVPCTTSTFDGRPCGVDQSGGNYEYAGGDSFDLFGVDWKSFRNEAENPAAIQKGQ